VFSMKHKFQGSMTGFSLLEVLIAATIFSIGLAGLSALLLANIISSAEARNKSTATLMAANLAEQISLNTMSVDRYINPSENIASLCTNSSICTPEQQADYDYKTWRIELANAIHNANGIVCRDGTPLDGDAGNDHCDGNGPLVIKIFWEGRSTHSSTADEQQINQQRFILEVG